MQIGVLHCLQTCLVNQARVQLFIYAAFHAAVVKLSVLHACCQIKQGLLTNIFMHQLLYSKLSALASLCNKTFMKCVY